MSEDPDYVPAWLREAGCRCYRMATGHECEMHPATSWCPHCLPIHGKHVLLQGGEAGRLGHLAIVHGTPPPPPG